jgi:flavin reductase (DIM6/NTAB) family NADH-FMN oxidoreductase RutF
LSTQLDPEEPKVDLPTGKEEWQPSLLIGQMLLVSSCSSRGEPNAARKCWASMVCSEPPMIGLACRLSHRTAINILETREFVINVPGEEIAQRVWTAGDTVSSALDPPAEKGWRFIPSRRVAAPRVEECRGHVECVLEATHRLSGEEVLFIARIVAVSADRSILEGPAAARYAGLRPVFALDAGLFAPLGPARTRG